MACPTPESSIRRRPLPWVQEIWAALACLLAAIALTWPMAAQFNHMSGDGGDHFQTLWSWRWLHDALASFRSPFFTDRVYFPQGATLVFIRSTFQRRC